MCHNLVITFSSPRVMFKPESSGQSRTDPSPSLCLSLSWRGPLGKSSSLRLSTEKQTGTQTPHRLTAQPCLSSAKITRFFSRPPESSATTCHTPLRVSVASSLHPSSSSSHLCFAKTSFPNLAVFDFQSSPSSQQFFCYLYLSKKCKNKLDSIEV